MAGLTSWSTSHTWVSKIKSVTLILYDYMQACLKRRGKLNQYIGNNRFLSSDIYLN
jgi:hypothetical protein